MLDEERRPQNPLWLFLASYATLGLRSVPGFVLPFFGISWDASWERLTSVNLNDAMIRSLLFMPLYTKFIMTMHRPSDACFHCLGSQGHRDVMGKSCREPAPKELSARDCVSGQPHALTRFFGSRLGGGRGSWKNIHGCQAVRRVPLLGFKISNPTAPASKA